MTDEPSVLIQALGRLHPLLVHLPIGFIVVIATLEGLALIPRYRHVISANRIILVISVPAVIISAACGWFLSWSGGYNPELLAWHKWLGTALAPATIILLVLHYRDWTSAYRVALLATVFLLSVAGHFGGSLTHGSDYLFFFGKKPAVQKENPKIDENITNAVESARPVFATLIQPVFNEYCVSCHGAEKIKGGLRLDTAEQLFKGGDSGDVVERGNAAASLLIKRMLLPEDVDEHMPPSGKAQPTAAQLALLKWWITVGAGGDGGGRFEDSRMIGEENK